MVLLQIQNLADQLGIAQYIPKGMGTGFLWLVIGVFIVAVIGGLIAYVIYTQVRKGSFKIDVLVMESHDGVPFVRSRDRGRILATPDGPTFEFMRERPLIPPAPPTPADIVPGASMPEELLHFDFTERMEAAQKTLDAQKKVARWKVWVPRRNPFDPIRGARTQISKHMAHFIANSKKNLPLVIFLYREGHYVPVEWDLKEIDYAKLKVLKPADLRFFLEMAQKLVKRHLMRDSWLSKYGPLLGFIGAIAVLIVGMTFLYLQNKDLVGVTTQALSVSDHTLQTAQAIAQPQGSTVPPPP